VKAALRMSLSCCYTLSNPSAEGAGKVSRRADVVATFWLAPAKVGHCPSPVTVGCYGPLCLEHGLAMVQFSQLVLNGCSLAREFAPSLCGPVLDVSLQGVLLVLLISS
jgi:hypothetical protein